MYKIISLAFLFSMNLHATIVFLDTNNNDLEIQAAKEQALIQGEKFISYPPKGESFDTETAMKLLKDNKASTVFLSGHNGGGTISGGQGQIDRTDFTNYIANNKDAFESIKALGLIGCNTANHSEILKWKEIMPNLSFIAGYDGSAPSQKWIQGRKYIKEIIAKKDEIFKSTESSEIEALLKSFSHMDTLQASLFVDAPVCSDPEDYNDQFIYRPKTAEKQFDVFFDNECKEKMDHFENHWMPIFNAYLGGEKEIPLNTSEGDLRDLYTHVRQNEHCFEKLEDYPSGNRVLFLLFFKDFFKNFTTYYGKHLNQFFEELKLYENTELLDKARLEKLKSIEKQKALITSYLNDLSLVKADLNKRLEIAEKEKMTFARAAEYSQMIEDFIASGRADMEGAYENFIADKNEEFIKFIGYWGNTKHLKDSIESFNEQVVKEELQSMLENMTYTETQLDEGSWETSKKTYMENFKKLKVKNLEDFKLLSRKELLAFIHDLHQFDFEVTGKEYYLENIKDAMSSRLDYISDNGINFDWHDSNLGFPRDPRWLNNAQLDKDYNESEKSDESNIIFDYIFN